MKTRSLALQLIAALSLAGAAGKPAAAAVLISGDATINASSNVQTNISLGEGTKTANETGVVTDNSSVHGNVNINAASGVQTAVALSPGGSATTEVGTIDAATVHGSSTISAYAGSATALTILPGSSTCVAVGSVGPGNLGAGSTAAGAGAVLAVDIGLFTTSHVNIGTLGRPC